MASLQEQIDDLNRQLANLQDDISKRAKRTDVNTINVEVSAEQIQLDTKLADLEECLRELLSGLIDAREELRTHTH
jgi:hypothetical protein